MAQGMKIGITNFMKIPSTMYQTLIRVWSWRRHLYPRSIGAINVWRCDRYFHFCKIFIFQIFIFQSNTSMPHEDNISNTTGVNWIRYIKLSVSAQHKNKRNTSALYILDHLKAIQ